MHRTDFRNHLGNIWVLFVMEINFTLILFLSKCFAIKFGITNQGQRKVLYLPVCKGIPRIGLGFLPVSMSAADEIKLAFLREAMFMSRWGGLSPTDYGFGVLRKDC